MVGLFDYCYLENISDKIHTEKDSLWCEFLCEHPGDFVVKNISNKTHTETVAL